MKRILLALSLLLASHSYAATDSFAHLALSCITQEYPNKIAHVLQSDADAGTPRQLTPAFYGCFDWHSSVHGHWLLVRLINQEPEASFVTAAKSALATNLSNENIAIEVAYLNAKGRASFERPYGLAWLLQLVAELDQATDPELKTLRENLTPLEAIAAQRFLDWLPKLSHAIRTGEHSQTAFAFGLALDWARQVKNTELESLLIAKANTFYANDRQCPLSYEPSGQDFLSPCLAEADLMRRILSAKDFAKWLRKFLPEIPRRASSRWLDVATVTDKSDGKLAHLDGLNLSRAWMLEGIASGLPTKDKRRAAILAAAKAQSVAGLASVTGEDYAGGHWLASFATYLSTKRGIQ